MRFKSSIQMDPLDILNMCIGIENFHERLKFSPVKRSQNHWSNLRISNRIFQKFHFWSAEITKIDNLRNKIAHALRNLILLKFQLSENKWLGKRRSGCQICGWDLLVRHQNHPDQKTTSPGQN